MTAPSGRSVTPDAGPRPTLLTVAAILLGVTAILGVLVPISQLTDRTYVGCQIAVASANASPTASPSSSASPSPSASTTRSAEEQRRQFDDCVARNAGAITPADGKAVSDATVPLLLQGLLPFILLAGLAFFAFRGVPLVRWFTVGAWVIGGFIGLIPFGPLQAFQVTQLDLPVLTSVLLIVGSITFTAAVVLVNVKPVTAYFSAKRPVRTVSAAGGRPGGGGLFGGLFGPRPVAGGKGTPTSSSTSTTSLEKAPPANPASRSKGSSGGSGRSGGSGNTGRAKGKRRG